VNLFANSAYSSIAPFYPVEAVKKGVPAEILGFIFSGYSISMCLISPLLGKFMDSYGRKPLLIAGCFCEV
jgi:MFS family permease